MRSSLIVLCTWLRCAFRSGYPRAGCGPAGRTRPPHALAQPLRHLGAGHLPPDLSELVVRLARPDERLEWDRQAELLALMRWHLVDGKRQPLHPGRDLRGGLEPQSGGAPDGELRDAEQLGAGLDPDPADGRDGCGRDCAFTTGIATRHCSIFCYRMSGLEGSTSRTQPELASGPRTLNEDMRGATHHDGSAPLTKAHWPLFSPTMNLPERFQVRNITPLQPQPE